jgi:hypothetical protein
MGAEFGPSPSGPLLCGFALPGFIIGFDINIRLPSLPAFTFPPLLNFMIALNCDLADPISATVEFGGGRQPNMDPDPFEETP